MNEQRAKGMLGLAVRAREACFGHDACRKMIESGNFSPTEEANGKICAMAQEETTATQNKILLTASEKMKNGYKMADN